QILLLEENHKFIEYQDVNDPNAAYWMWHEFVEEGTKTIELGFPPQIQAATIPLTLTLGYQPDYFSVTPETVWFQFDGHPVPVSITSARDNLARATAELCPAWITPGTHEIQLYFPDGKSAPAHNQKTYLDAIELAVPCSIVAGTQPYQVDSQQATLSPPPGTDQVWYVPTPSDLSTTAYWAPAAAAAYSIPGGTASGQVYYLPATAPIATVTVEAISAPVTRTFDPLDTRQTDLILIAPRAWLSALLPYQKTMENHGTACRVVAVEDLYDYFGEGRLSPHAIKAFLRFAASQWQRPWPSYCILVGDATWDYWNRFGLGLKNYVPSYHEEKEYAVESWYVRLDEGTDDVPDMIVGRWPMQSQEGLLTLIQKTLLYQQNPTPGAWWNTLFVLTDDGFENYTDELLAQWIPSGFRQIRRHIKDYPLVDNIYLPEPLRRTMRAKTSLEATADVIKIINDGVFLWEFFGHGAPNVLGEERMFFGGGSKYSEVKKLINQKKLPFLWAFTCETAKFDYAQEKWNISIGEDLLTHPDGGVITLLGATGRGYPREHLLLAQGLHKAAFDYKFKTQGQIFLAALLMGITESSFFEPLKQFALLGDPTLRFPEFQSIPGTLTPSDKGWTYQWDIASPLPALTTWEQGERDPLAASPVPPSATSIIQGHLPWDKRDTITRVGVDSVQIKESHVTIAQGALPLPEFKEAEAFIAPTTGVLPDLSFVPGSLTVQPQSPFSGQTVFLEAKVRNTGQASARNISIAGYDGIPQRNTMPLHAEVGERNRRLAYLHPGQVAPIRLRWDPTDNEGNHTLVLEIDTSKSIEEEDETNNQIETSLYVRKKADLIVNATKVNLIPIENGRQSQLQFEIFNQGESFAERITIELALKLAGQDQESTIIIPRLISLQASETYNAAGIRLKTPLDQIERLTITIDPDEIVDEESHANNQYIYVKP
ncbi:MAG: C25 family cysteine peptidase, partial [bacterium]|nr:C25 family cysteine peptidase [bacterium]